MNVFIYSDSLSAVQPCVSNFLRWLRMHLQRRFKGPVLNWTCTGARRPAACIGSVLPASSGITVPGPGVPACVWLDCAFAQSVGALDERKFDCSGGGSYVYLAMAGTS